MDVLVLGNGFDLAHNLPTKYEDFLEFVRIIKDLLKGKSLESVDWGKLNQRLKLEITMNVKNSLGSIYENKDNWLKLIDDNIWVEYFSQTFINENWIDFESAIATIIKSLDEDMYDKQTKKRESLKAEMQNLSNAFLERCYKDSIFLVQVIDLSGGKTEDKRITYEEIRDKLLNDLNNLVRALEIYLSEFVNKIKVTVESPDIKGISPDKILSFNYTDTYERVYSQKNNIEFDYIHGKADLCNIVGTNNLVLGIDEYLLEERRNTDVDFIAFKKFYQRIHKETGCLYKDWVETMQSYVLSVAPDFETDDTYTSHKLYIFGHSLDITDKDILKDLILNDKVDTTIFYFNRDVYGQQIANLVKVIGQDELIRRTGGPTKTITFKQQRSMENKA